MATEIAGMMDEDGRLRRDEDGELLADLAARVALARTHLLNVYDGPETPNGSAIAMALAILDGEPNALHIAAARDSGESALIAAAPRLLAVVEQVEDLFAGYETTPEEEELWVAARAAIAAAKETTRYRAIRNASDT